MWFNILCSSGFVFLALFNAEIWTNVPENAYNDKSNKYNSL